MPKLIDLTGQKYGKLTVIKRGPNKYGRTAWLCNCECGNTDILCTGNDLRMRKITSCGCGKNERIQALGKKNKIDIIGKQYGQLTVTEETNERASGGDIIWKCRCSCGNITYSTKASLDKGDMVSCGCHRKTVNLKELRGERFGKLIVIDKIYRENQIPHVLWQCQCDCGNTCIVPSKNLLQGSTQSCGCLLSKGEQKLQNIFEINNIKFEAQKTFETCRFPNTNRKAKFDFYLSDYNILIEYDGIQHFQQTGWGTFEITQQNDTFKNQWCKANNIPLIRIPYNDFEKLDIDYIRRKINEIIGA